MCGNYIGLNCVKKHTILKHNCLTIYCYDLSMKKLYAISFIEKQLTDLDISKNSDCWNAVYSKAIEAADIMNKKELIKFIEELVEFMPLITRE